MNDDLLKTEVASKDWVSLEIKQSTKKLVTRKEMKEYVKLSLKPYPDWKWALGAILSLCGIFFAGIWAIFKFV